MLVEYKGLSEQNAMDGSNIEQSIIAELNTW